jgi:general secretion pathway protein A
LDQQETENYINHRLLVAGSHGSVKFSARALSRIYRDCDGIPRTVNLLCDRVLLTAYARGTKAIDHRIVRQAGAELEGGTSLGVPTSRVGVRQRWRVIGELTAVALLALLGGAFWLGYLPARHLGVPAMAPFTTPMAPAKISETIQPDGGRESAAARSAKPSFAAPLAVAAKVAADDVAAPRLEPQNAEVAKSARSAPADVDVLEQRLEGSKPSGRLQPGTKEFAGDVRLRALLWEYARLGQQGGDGAKPTLAGVAANYSLEVLPIWTDLHRLKQFRVACVLETVSPDSSEPTLLIPRASSAEGVEVMDALGTVRRYSDAEFMQVWFGRAYLFHRSGTALKGILSRGKRDSEVQTLQQQLGELGYLAMAPTGVFDGETAEAVRRLQRDHYLQVDGAVGPATKILLYHLSGRPLDIL